MKFGRRQRHHRQAWRPVTWPRSPTEPHDELDWPEGPVLLSAQATARALTGALVCNVAIVVHPAPGAAALLLVLDEGSILTVAAQRAPLLERDARRFGIDGLARCDDAGASGDVRLTLDRVHDVQEWPNPHARQIAGELHSTVIVDVVSTPADALWATTLDLHTRDARHVRVSAERIIDRGVPFGLVIAVASAGPRIWAAIGSAA